MMFLVCTLAMSPRAAAGPITIYQAIDGNVGPGSPLPASDAAHASFTAASASLGDSRLVTFEGEPLGPFTTLTIAPGVTLTMLPGGGAGEISNNTSSPGLGFNTTPGGSEFFRMRTDFIPPHTSTNAAATFAFAMPVDAFGGYFTGLGGGGDTVSLRFVDGASETLNLSDTGNCSPSCAEFFGFTDPGALISSITLNMAYTNQDPSLTFAYFIGADDVQFSAVPEPASLALFGSGILALAARRKKSKSDRV